MILRSEFILYILYRIKKVFLTTLVATILTVPDSSSVLSEFSGISLFFF
jgi:hypothetical protein